MKSWLRQLAELANILRYLRPYVAERPWLFVAVVGSSLLVMCFEGIGVGLLVPLLNLLLGGENATPMRPIEWLQRTFPGRSPAFYVSTVCSAIIAAIAAKNVALYTSQILAANLKRQVSISLRNTLFGRVQRADLDVFDRTPGGELSNVFLLETYRATNSIDVLLGMLQRYEHRALLCSGAGVSVLAADDSRSGAQRRTRRDVVVRVQTADSCRRGRY